MRRSRQKGHNCRDFKAGRNWPPGSALAAYPPAAAAEGKQRPVARM